MNEKTLLAKIERMEQEINELRQFRENTLLRRLERLQQRIRKRVTLPLAVVLVTVMSSLAIASYFSPPTFQTGQTISAAAFTDYFQQISDRLWGISGTDLYYDGGDVGIGTSTPGGKLEVSNGTVGIQINPGQYYDEGVVLDDNWVQFDIPGYKNVNFSENLVVTSGNMGIGTTTPQHLLDLGKQNGPKLAVYQNDTGDGFYGFGISAYTMEVHANSPTGATGEAKMVVQSNGNIGIGTTTPSTKLETWSAARTDAYSASNTDTWADAIIRNPVNDGDAATGLMFGIESNPAYAGPGIAGVAEGAVGGANPQGLAFLTVNGGDLPAERMRINNDGNVGIGTANPGAKLDVQKYFNYNTDHSYDPLIIGVNSNSMDNNYVYGYAFRNSTIDPSFPTRGDKLSIVEKRRNATDREVMTFRNATVGIGITNPGSYKLYVAGNAYSTGIWGSSDKRWKRNIAPLENSLNKVLRLQGVSFEWDIEQYSDKGFEEGQQVGVIAQEVEKVVPELVSTDIDGYKAVAYDKITALLIEAVKELKTENEALKSSNEDLKFLVCQDHPEAGLCQ